MNKREHLFYMVGSSLVSRPYSHMYKKVGQAKAFAERSAKEEGCDFYVFECKMACDPLIKVKGGN